MPLSYLMAYLSFPQSVCCATRNLCSEGGCTDSVCCSSGICACRKSGRVVYATRCAMGFVCACYQLFGTCGSKLLGGVCKRHPTRHDSSLEFLTVIRNKFGIKFPCGLVDLPLLLDWCKEQGRCSSAAFPSAPLIIHVSHQRLMML